MGTLDSAFRDLASTLMGVFTDELWVLKRTPEEGAGYLPSKGIELVPTPVTYQTKLSPPQKYSLRDIDGTSIKRGDLQAFLAAKDVPITPDSSTDVLIAPDGQRYSIISVEIIKSGDQVAMFVLQLRK